VLAALPRAGDTIRGVSGREFRVDQVTHIANGTDGLGQHAVVFATKSEPRFETDTSATDADISDQLAAS
jgi:hypothetical protein